MSGCRPGPCLQSNYFKSSEIELHMATAAISLSVTEALENITNTINNHHFNYHQMINSYNQQVLANSLKQKNWINFWFSFQDDQFSILNISNWDHF